MRQSVPTRGRARAALALGLATLGAPSLSSAGSYTIPAFNATSTNAVWRNVDLLAAAGGAITPNNYVGYSLEVDWLSGGNSSSTAVTFMTSAPFSANTNPNGTGGGTRYTRGARPSENANASTNVTSVSSLRFRAAFTDNSSALPISYPGGASPLYLDYRHTANTTAQWDNVRVTLYDNYDDMLDVTDVGTLTPGTNSFTVPYSRRDSVRWFKFKVGANMGLGDFVSVDTLGNTLIGGGQGDGDTKLFFAGTNGLAGVENDNFMLNGTPTRASAMVFGDAASSPFASSSDFALDSFALVGDLYYYVAVTVPGSTRLTLPGAVPFNVVGAIDQATAGVDINGSYTVNFNTNILPAPGAAGLLGLGLLGAMRRRR
jgi:hypothetical protein